MTQENKELLLKDLSTRLPYGVKIELMPITRGKCTTLTPIILYDYYISDDVNYLPYLFPLSSMTEEQKIECFKGTPLEIDKYGNVAVKDDFYGNSQYTDLEIYLEVIDWFNKNHFDYRGLIKKGLAIDATNLNIY